MTTLAAKIRDIIWPDGSPLASCDISALSREHGVSRDAIDAYSRAYVKALGEARTCNEALDARPAETGLSVSAEFPAVGPVDVAWEHGPGLPVRLSRAVRVY